MEQVTRAELLEVVYRFYPRGVAVDLAYEATEERRRQRAALERANAEAATWYAMLRRLRARYGQLTVTDYSVLIEDGRHDPAWSAKISIHGCRIGFCVCVLGPYYGIQRTGAAGEEAAALDLAREIEATYPGYQPIPPELGDEVVPDVAFDFMGFGDVTIHHCLLSDMWESRAEPSPPPDPLLSPEVPRRGSVLDRGDVPDDDGPTRDR